LDGNFNVRPQGGQGAPALKTGKPSVAMTAARDLSLILDGGFDHHQDGGRDHGG
jgi:hypothetical protein